MRPGADRDLVSRTGWKTFRSLQVGGVDDAVPARLVALLSARNGIWSVPVNIHRSNVTWYVPANLRSGGSHRQRPWKTSSPPARRSRARACSTRSPSARTGPTTTSGIGRARRAGAGRLERALDGQAQVQRSEGRQGLGHVRKVLESPTPTRPGLSCSRPSTACSRQCGVQRDGRLARLHGDDPEAQAARGSAGRRRPEPAACS